MSLNLIGFIKKLVPTLSRSDLEIDLDASLDHIPVIQTAYGNLASAYTSGKFNSKIAKELNLTFTKEFNKHPRKDKLRISGGLAVDTLTLFANVKTNGEKIKKEIAEIANEVIVSQAMTASKANIIRAVGHLYFVTKFALDLLNYVYANEAMAAGIELTKESIPNAKQIQLIDKNLWIYARILSVYGSDPKFFSDELDGISKITIPKEMVEEVVDHYTTDKVDIFDNLPAGFVGSPIYTVRLIFAQWEADRYKQLKDKKKLLELRYLHLRMVQEQGDGNVATEKEMEFLQKHITDIDYKTSRIEADCND